ncbi:MAG TPA: hypothetical protein VMV43_06110 [Candidatus Nanopelagicaceae bacterium]|nr:hypothetical protein [Candidatus Nanopelagicaceae bacterium]
MQDGGIFKNVNRVLIDIWTHEDLCYYRPSQTISEQSHSGALDQAWLLLRS